MNTSTGMKGGLQLLIGASATMIALSQLEDARAQELYEEGNYLEYVFNGGNIQNLNEFRLNEYCFRLRGELSGVGQIGQDKYTLTLYNQTNTDSEGFYVNTLETSLHERLVIGGVGVTSLYSLFERF